MATSNSTNYSTTRDTLIKGALRVIGAIGQGETPSANATSEAAEALEYLVKALMAKGMPLWAIKEYAVTLSASTTSYTIGEGQTVNTPKPMKVIQAFLRNTSSNVDTPVRILTRQDYNMLGNKSSTGQPIQIFYEPLRNYGILHVFPTPDSTSASSNTLHIIYQRPFEDFDSSGNEPDFPQEWFDALKFGLADRLAPEYGLSIQERQDIARRYKDALDDALGFGTEEGSIYFGADRRNW